MGTASFSFFTLKRMENTSQKARLIFPPRPLYFYKIPSGELAVRCGDRFLYEMCFH